MSEIYAFGDSVLKGIVLENEKYKVCKNRFSNICQDVLNVVIENKAKFGSTISVGEKSFEKNLSILDNPDVEYVVLEFGGNDCDFKWQEISDNPNMEHSPNIEVNEFVKMYTEIIQEIKSKNKKPVLLSLPPIDSQRYMHKISKNLNKENILKWMNNNIYFLTNWHERYNIEVFKLAINNNVSIIDITSKFLEQKDYSLFLCEDGIHPNEEGHKIISEAIQEHVSKKNIQFN
ncbi:MAG: SGNH/GDSL hydrolase family protein [Clostridia bacterium]